jgi:hypothetical protein
MRRDEREKLRVGIREFAKAEQRPSRLFFEVGGKLVVVSVLVALGIHGWQCYVWTTSGTWPTVRLADAVAFCGLDLRSLFAGNDAGTLAILGQIPLDLPAALMVPLLTVLQFACISMFL